MEPKLRKVWTENLPSEDGSGFVLKDPLRLADPYPIDPQRWAAAQLLDGKRTLKEVRSELARTHGIQLEASDLKNLVSDLERLGYLEDETFRTLLQRSRSEFEALEVRPYLFQGESYPDEPEELERLLAAAEDASRLRAMGWREAEHGPVRAIVAPHIDPNLAAEAYAEAYAATPDGAPLLFVLLGTCHVPGTSRFIATRKDFRTPHGILQTDGSFVERLEKLYGHDLQQDEIFHRTEHSLEFQALYLRYRYRQSRPGAVRIVPILVSSFQEFVRADRYPGDIPDVNEFLGALRQSMQERERSGERVILVAGVDFAHVGEKFGDSEPITDRLLADLEAADRASMEHMEHMDGRAFFRSLAQDGNARRWCGLAPITCLLEIAGADRGIHLAYGRDHRPGQTYTVTFGALSFHKSWEE